MANHVLVYRHNRVTRFTHWTNAVALMILLMSGLMIFNAHPHLYWGNTSEPNRVFLSIGAQSNDSHTRGYVEIFGIRVETTGFLGVARTADGPSERAFPSWLTVPGYYSLAGGRRWHFFFSWLFTLNGLVYVAYNLAAGHLRKFFLTPCDARKIPAMIAYYLKLRKTSPQEGEYNPLQKMAYTSVFVILTPLILLSGMAMSPQLDVAFNWIPALFGGRQSARSVHFILAFSFLFFTFGHVFMVVTQGLFNNLRSMTTGWYKEKLPAHREAPPTAVTVKPTPGRIFESEPLPNDEPTSAPQPLSDQASAGANSMEVAKPESQPSTEAKPADTNPLLAEKEDSKHV